MFPVSIYTLGCRLNQLESEAIAFEFKKEGFKIDNKEEFPQTKIIIINTCTVTSKAEQKARRIIRKSLQDYPEACVVVTGCYAILNSEEILSLDTDKNRIFVLGIGGKGAGDGKSSLLKLPEYLLKNSGKNIQKTLNNWAKNEKPDSPFSFKPQEFAFHSRGYLKIQDGCNNTCNYCRVRFARGMAVSLAPEKALEQLLLLGSKGCQEIMLTGINVTQYNHSGFNFAELLEYLLKNSKNIFIRLSSLEPEGITEELISVIKHPRIRPHFHISVQSGNDAILKKMGRVYESQTIKNCVLMFRKAKENPFLACDIIAGFPGETNEEFDKTFAFLKELNFAWIHVFPYSKRPGTAAFSFRETVCQSDVSGRVKKLTALGMQGRRDYAAYWTGKKISAIVEKDKPGHAAINQCIAVSENYLKLIVNYSGEVPKPGSAIICTPVSLCEGADGEKPDAIADIIRNW